MQSLVVVMLAVSAVTLCRRARADGALVSWWRAEGNAGDSAGSNNGSLFGGTTFAAGTSGQAFSFDGVDDVVNVPDSASLTITGSLTIDAWIKPAAYPGLGGGLIVFRGDDRGGFDPYFLRLNEDGHVEFGIQNAANTSSAVLSQVIPLNVFTHVTATLDDATGQQTIYINDAFAASAITTVRPLSTLEGSQNPGVSIGNHNRYAPFTHNFPFNGLIDEVKIYNSVVPEPACASLLTICCTAVAVTRRRSGRGA